MDKDTATFSVTNELETNPSFSIKGRDREIFYNFVMEAGFSIRVTNVLLANVESLEAFEELTEEDLYGFRNCGRKTVREIVDFLKTFGVQKKSQTPVAIQTSVPIEELFFKPPNDSTIAMLPIFSNKPLPQLTTKDLHPDFHGDVKLEAILLSCRTFNALFFQGQMETIGDVMLTTTKDLLALRNFGRKCLKEIQKAVRSLFKTGNYTPRHQEIEYVFMDYTSYERLISSYSQLCLKNERDQLLMQKMFLFDSVRGPTLEAIGQYFDITRERVRQIVNRAIRRFNHPANTSNLKPFWKMLDQIITKGGGLIDLQELSEVLKVQFNWPIPPNPVAFGKFLSVRGDGSKYKEPNDLIKVDCDCLSCEIPLDFFAALDFSEHDSFHVAVLGSKLGGFCQQRCPWDHSKDAFHRAFIEKKVGACKEIVLHEDLVYSRDKWLESFCPKLEGVARHVLERNGRPMHFTEIAEEIRKNNINFKELSDHNLHSAIIRYETFRIVGRGTYALSSWEIQKYRSVSSAIEEFLDLRGLPQRRQQIVSHLEGEFSEGNITAALSFESRFISIGDGIYDRQRNWNKRTLENLIQVLPESVAQFAQYLTGRNNTSYKLVMGFIFIRSMDDTGAIYLHKLKTMFYNFYLSRHKKGLIVEVESVTMHRIAELDKNELINLTCRRPLESFFGSGYFVRFSQQGQRLKLIDSVVNQLDASTRDNLIITILKAIDDYFLAISPHDVNYESPPEDLTKVSESGIESKDSVKNTLPENSAAHVHIKKKRRGKIKL
jgi:hypothetical protein